MKKTDFEEMRELVKKKFEKEKMDASHDFAHAERTIKYCEMLGKKEKADLEVLRYAALLHDYSRESPLGPKGDHSYDATEAAGELLRGKLPPEKIKQVQHAIFTHDKDNKRMPRTLEAKILWDADKLDAVGPTGAARYMARGALRRWDIDFTIKRGLKRLGKLWKESFYTKTGKRIGKAKIKKCKEVCAELLYDLNPKNFR